MRYEVRLIGGTDHSDSRTKLREILLATDDADEAKRYAQQHAHDGEMGTAIVDHQAGTVDIGTDERMPLAGFRI